MADDDTDNAIDESVTTVADVDAYVQPHFRRAKGVRPVSELFDDDENDDESGEDDGVRHLGGHTLMIRPVF